MAIDSPADWRDAARAIAVGPACRMILVLGATDVGIRFGVPRIGRDGSPSSVASRA